MCNMYFLYSSFKYLSFYFCLALFGGTGDTSSEHKQKLLSVCNLCSNGKTQTKRKVKQKLDVEQSYREGWGRGI